MSSFLFQQRTFAEFVHGLGMHAPQNDWCSIGNIQGAAGASAVWPSANLCISFPLVLVYPVIAKGFLWRNGTSVSASYKIDCGIWACNPTDTSTGTLIASTGSVDQGTASAVQYAALSGGNVALGAGLYQLGMTCSDGAATFFRNALTSSVLSAIGIKTKASATIPLSSSMATITWETNGSGYLPFFAIQTSPESVY